MINYSLSVWLCIQCFRLTDLIIILFIFKSLASVSLLYMLPMIFFFSLLSYEYLIRFITTHLNLSFLFNFVDIKLKSYHILCNGINKFNVYLIISFFLSFKYIGGLKLGVFTIYLYLLLTLVLLTYWKAFYLDFISQKNLLFVSFSFYFSILVLFIFLIINNLILFLLALELVAVLYYFFFLNILSASTLSLIRYKNFLILYLLNSLLTTILFSLGILIISWSTGTLAFSELLYFYDKIIVGVLLILLSLGWKLGLPGLHFFKLELYNYIPLSTFFFFSILSLLLNTYILVLFFFLFKLTLLLYINIFLTFMLTISCILLSRASSSITGYQFIAYSTLATLTILTTALFLIDDKTF